MKSANVLAKMGLVAVLLGGASGAIQAANGNDFLLMYQGADRQQKLIEAAKKEGSFTLYTSIAQKDLPALIGPFEEKYGIKANVWRAGTDKVVQRTVNENNAGRYDVDVVHIATPEMEALRREKIFQPVTSPHHKDLIARATPEHQEFAATLLSVWVQAYNTNLVKKEELPKTYEDLLDPKWKGKLGIENRNQDWFASVVNAMGEEKGKRFFNDLVSTNGISARKGHTTLTNMVVAGEIPVALTVYNYMPEQAKAKGAPIDWFALQPTIARSNAIGIARHAKNPAAAALFYDFMLSEEGQKILTKLEYVPTNAKVESPLKGLKLEIVDPVKAVDNMQKWNEDFQETVVKKSKS